MRKTGSVNRHWKKHAANKTVSAQSKSAELRVRFRHCVIDIIERNAKCAAREYRIREFVMIVPRIVLLSLIASISVANAADCPRKDALGTSRVMTVDPRAFPRVGFKSFPQSLPLADREVVLTFDDGPFPPTTAKVLATLASECVQATFFLIGRNAEANPDIVKRIATAGHTIGHHTWSHRPLDRIGESQAIEEIDRGIAADEMALHGVARRIPSTPFFRFPGFASTPSLLSSLQSRGIAVFGADLWASDWNPMTPEQQLNQLIERLDNRGKGIILLHDTKAQTAKMLPAFLQHLRRNGYKVVHLVAPRPVRSSLNDR
jgi:peptidoglycan/xylan/chitin deacetylase (PgdA/CDA1 family)